MDNGIRSVSRRERRRRLNDEKCESEDSEDIVVNQNGRRSRILVRRDTFTVAKKPFDDNISTDEIVSDDSKQLTHTIHGEESKNLTYDVRAIGDNDASSGHDTYNVDGSDALSEPVRPIPAPRRRLPTKDSEKNSSDTDRDVMEIEADASVEDPPVPKPRKLSMRQSFPTFDSASKSKSLEEITVRALSPRSTKSNPETTRAEPKSGEDVKKSPTPRMVQDGQKKTRRLAGLLRRRKRKPFSSVVRLEKARIPTISGILRDLKEDPSKAKLDEEDEEENIDIHIDSPRIPQSQQNDKLYVQGKNGFYVKSREEVFKREEEAAALTDGAEAGRMESMTCAMLRTASLFQKFWSRSMMYFHGLLAGLGFSHAFAVSAILIYLDRETEGFLEVYSYLALKIHFTFYALIALAVISCLDRLDVGDLKKKHCSYICGKCPCLWFILVAYIASFILTFVNHTTESRFDSHQYRNSTGQDLWDPEIYNDISEVFSLWYRIIWARDVMVLLAWLVISLSDFPDHFQAYVKGLSSRVENNSGTDMKLTEIVS